MSTILLSIAIILAVPVCTYQDIIALKFLTHCIEVPPEKFISPSYPPQPGRYLAENSSTRNAENVIAPYIFPAHNAGDGMVLFL
jgi:hypothetical protein